MAGQRTDIEFGEGSFECVCGSGLTVTLDQDGVSLLREIMFCHRPCSGLVQEVVYEEVPDDASGLDDE